MHKIPLYRNLLYKYIDISLIRTRQPPRPYSRPMPRDLWWSQEGKRTLTSGVPLYTCPLSRGRAKIRPNSPWAGPEALP
jgi:hypothetical protein